LEVAAAAQRFGQEDNLSVISVTRTAVLELPPDQLGMSLASGEQTFELNL
jgi:hypothetical protein